MFWGMRVSMKELLQNAFVYRSDKTKQKHWRGRNQDVGFLGGNKHTQGPCATDTRSDNRRRSVKGLSGATQVWHIHDWPPFSPPTWDFKSPLYCQPKDKLCLSSQRWQVKYSFPLKGNGGFCSFSKSLCSKQEELHVVSSYALHVSNFQWSIHCSHFQNPGGGGTGQGASFCFLFNGYDPFLQSKFVLDGDKYAVLIHKGSGSWAQKALFCIWDLQPWLHFLHSTIINNLSGMMQEPATQRGFACERVERENSRVEWQSTPSRRHWVWLFPKLPAATTTSPWDTGGDQWGHFPPQPIR